MNARRLPMLALTAALTGCAAPTIQVQDCGSPPKMPEAVQSTASEPRQSYFERLKPLLRRYEMLLEIAPD